MTALLPRMVVSGVLDRPLWQRRGEAPHTTTRTGRRCLLFLVSSLSCLPNQPLHSPGERDNRRGPPRPTASVAAGRPPCQRQRTAPHPTSSPSGLSSSLRRHLSPVVFTVVSHMLTADHVSPRRSQGSSDALHRRRRVLETLVGHPHPLCNAWSAEGKESSPLTRRTQWINVRARCCHQAPVSRCPTHSSLEGSPPAAPSPRPGTRERTTPSRRNSHLRST